MKYKISDLYIEIDSNSYKIGVVLGEEDKPTSPYTTETVTISEYEEGLKNFKYGKPHIHDCVYHFIGKYSTDGEPKPIKKKWIDELILRGYDVSKIKYVLEGPDSNSVESVASFLSNKTGNDYSFLIKNAHLGDHVCLIGLGGSWAYGTKTPESDLDVRGIAVNSAAEILTNQNFEQVLDSTTDTTIYSFNKMIKLLTDCNPNTIEILGLLPEHYLYINEVGQYLLDHKDIFLSKRVISTFGGYANAQLRRLDNKAMRTVGQSEQETHILHSIENASTTFPSRYFDYDSDSIKLYIGNSTQEDFDTEIFMDINLTHYPLRDWKGMWSEMSNIVKDYSKLGHRNKNAIARGKLGKHQMHLVRLYLMCIDILEKGEIITYRQKDHDFLMDIRNGKYLTEDNQPIPEFFEIVDDLEAKMKNAAEHSELPDKPRIKDINNLLIKVNHDIVMGYF